MSFRRKFLTAEEETRGLTEEIIDTRDRLASFETKITQLLTEHGHFLEQEAELNV